MSRSMERLGMHGQAFRTGTLSAMLPVQTNLGPGSRRHVTMRSARP
jgi:hypothetical protein